MSTITPELALVDPDLAAAARALLPEPGAFRPAWRTNAARRVLVTEVSPPPVTPPVSSLETTPRRRVGRRAALSVVGVAAVSGAALALTVGNVAIRWDGDRCRHRRAAELAHRRHSRSVCRSDVSLAVGPGCPRLQNHDHAGPGTVFETTTTKATIDLPASLEFPPGRYTWSATPQWGGSADGSPARPVIEESFVVQVAVAPTASADSLVPRQRHRSLGCRRDECRVVREHASAIARLGLDPLGQAFGDLGIREFDVQLVVLDVDDDRVALA